MVRQRSLTKQKRDNERAATARAEKLAVNAAYSTRTLPAVTRRTTQPLQHVNHGGICLGCGVLLGFWYHYQMCDKCLSGPPTTTRSPNGNILRAVRYA